MIATLGILAESDDGMHILRTCCHLLAQAVMELYPDAKAN